MRANLARLGADFERVRTVYPRAAVRALNRTATTVRASTARAIAQDTGIAVGVAKEAITIQLATQTTLIARVIVTGKRPNVYDYNARGPQPSRGKGRGVVTRMRGGATRYEHAFIATMRSGHIGVFQRDDLHRSSRRSPGAWGKNLPIHELKGVSFPRVFQKQADARMAEATDLMAKNLAHELAFASGALS